ncbi:unannotated protein [freshwater metagenome]|uniref:Unannotated protein n=1 Tax=freshwater metagenome TaxID=449393 RepID=A0A6J6IBQ9_9ZZZZ
MEHTGSPGTDTKGHDHVAKLRNRGVRQHLLEVGLHECQQATDDGGEAAYEGDVMEGATSDRKTGEEHAVEASDQIHTCDNHGRSMNECRHWRRTSHSVGQPGMQWELA